MTWSRRTWVLGSVAVLHAASALAQGPGVTEREIRSLLDQSVAAWNRGDLDGHLADNADSIALRRSFLKDGKPIRRLRFEQMTVRRLGDAHALVVGRFILDGGGAAGAQRLVLDLT